MFLAVVIAISVLGWRWTGNHQTAPQARASRAVLTLGILAGAGALTVLWRRRQQ